MTATINGFSDFELRNPCAEIECAAPTYRREKGVFAFYLDGEKIFVSDEISVVMDLETGCMLRHGLPQEVQSYFLKATKAYRAAGFGHIADSLVCLTGAFDARELNQLVQLPASANRFYKTLMQYARQVPAEPLAWLVEFTEGSTGSAEKHVQHVVFEQPKGHYAGCATPITDERQLDELLATQA